MWLKVHASYKANFDLLKEKTKSENLLEGYGVIEYLKKKLKYNCNSEIYMVENQWAVMNEFLLLSASLFLS